MLGGCAFEPPETVVAQLADAAANNDREAFAACFTERSRAVVELWWTRGDQLAPELVQLRGGEATVVDVRAFSEREGGIERAVVIVREGEREMPLVLHRVGGRWRVDLLDTERVAMSRGML